MADGEEVWRKEQMGARETLVICGFESIMVMGATECLENALSYDVESKNENEHHY
jgi:hypothetical protein